MFPRGSFIGGFFSTIFLVSFSCTIIQDGDITSLDGLNSLKLKGVEINQQTNSGNSITTAQLVFDSVKNVVDPVSGVQIVRKMKFSLQSLSNLKMKLRSKSGAITSIIITYTLNDKPYKFLIQEGNTIIESYVFRYNTANTLYKIVTTISPVGGPIETTTDSLIYNTSSRVSSIIRKSPDAAKAGTITVQYQNSLITGIGFKYSYQTLSGYCPNGIITSSCGGYQITPFSQSFNPSLFFQFQNLNEVPSRIELNDIRFQGNDISNCQGCGRELDTYYLHPLMLTKNQFVFGNELMMIYMVDWWIPGTAAVANPSINRNDLVILDFKYGI